MPAPFAIPGYYWDEQRQKFFKVEKTGTAPAGAFWSRENAEHVERRQQKQQQQQQQHRRKKRRRTRERAADDKCDNDNDDGDDDRKGAGVQRSGLDDCCFFACAAGGPPQRSTASAAVSDGRRFPASALSLAAGVLGGSLTASGAMAVLDEDEAEAAEEAEEAEEDDDDNNNAPEARRLIFGAALRRRPRLAAGTAVSCLYVHGGGGDNDNDDDDDDPSRLGIVYTNYSSTRHPGDIKGQYVATDENGCIPPSWPTEGRWAPYASFARTRPEGLPVPDASAICYHAGAHRLIVTSRRLAEPSGACIHLCAPRDRDDPTGRFSAVPWGVGRARARRRPFGGPRDDVVPICGSSAADAVYACAVAPAGAPGALCVVGTHRGLAVLDRERVALQPVPDMRRYRTYAQPLRPPGPDSRNSRHSHTAADAGQLVTSVDFLDRHPQLVVLGTRSPAPWLVDLREPVASRGQRLGSSGSGSGGGDGDGDHSNAVAHVRSVGGYGVVAAGLRNAMLLYDVRYTKARGSTATATPTPGDAALVRFADYHNEARLIGLGFAADARLGLVAVGEEHAAPTRLGGGVAVFSLATGARLATPGLVVAGGIDTGGTTRTGISHAAETIVQAYHGPATTAAAAGPAPRPSPLPRIQALSFASLPGEGPSLFAGVGPFVHKYSVGGQGEDVFI